jgi:hypothetical protein
MRSTPAGDGDASHRDVVGWLERRRCWLLAGLLGVSLGLRVWLALTGGEDYWPDEARYSSASREAVYQFAHGAPREAWKQLIGQADHLFFKIAGLPVAWWEFRYGEHPALVAIYFGLFSVAGLGLVYGIGRRAGAGAREALLAVFFAAGANSLFYYCRHFFPYDLSLFFCLLALGVALGESAWWRSVGAGLAAAFGFLSYNGYWLLGGVVLAAHVLTAKGIRRKLVRAACGLGGLLAPIAASVLAAHALGFDLIASYREFSRSITQGDFGTGYVFVWQYLWDAEGVLLLAWIFLIVAGIVATRALSRRLALWLGIAAALYLGLVICADVLKSFVVYGRTARSLVPFLCLGAAAAGEMLLSRRHWPRWSWAPTLALLVAIGGWHMAVTLRVVFPNDFIVAAARVAQTTGLGRTGLLRVLNAERLGEGKVMTESRPHEILLWRKHPLQFRPYLYEGYDSVQRQRFTREDLSMRLIKIKSAAPDLDLGATGAWRLRVRFPRNNDGVSEPLLTGGLPSHANFLYVQYVDGEHVRFGYDAWESGSLVSSPIKTDYGSEHEIVIVNDAGRPADVRHATERIPGTLLVTLDGETILSDRSVPSAIDPNTVFVGLNFVGGSSTRTNFTGEILSVEEDANWTRDFRQDSAWKGYPGPLRLSVTLPTAAAPWQMPLLRSGRDAAADRLFLDCDARGIFRLGFVHEPESPIFSDPVSAPELRELRVSLGDMLPPIENLKPEYGETIAWLYHRVTVVGGDQLLFQRVGKLRAATPVDFALGGKIKDASDARAQIAADPISPKQLLPWATQVRVGTSAEQLEWRGYPGALRLRIRFEPRPAGTSEPLVATGRTGAGDVIFVRQIGNGRVAFGHDHWGVGATLSESAVAVDGKDHELVIAFGALFPPGDDAPCYGSEPAWRRLRELQVIMMDGKILLAGPANFHPSRADEIHAGINPIGASSAEPFFSGEIIEMERASLDRLRVVLSQQ